MQAGPRGDHRAEFLKVQILYKKMAPAGYPTPLSPGLPESGKFSGMALRFGRFEKVRLKVETLQIHGPPLIVVAPESIMGPLLTHIREISHEHAT